METHFQSMKYFLLPIIVLCSFSYASACLEINEVSARPWLPAVCEALVAEGMTRLLVEGGPTLWSAFAKAGLADEVLLFRAGAAAIEKSGALELPDFLRHLLPGLTLKPIDRRVLGIDEMVTLRHDRTT